MFKKVNFEKLLIIFVIIICTLLSLKNLGNNSLWHDESEVAQIAKNILQFGIPTVYNSESFLPIGHTSNFHSQNSPYYATLQTWLMFYVASFGLWLFGFNLFAVRFPFVALGLLSLLIYFKLLCKINKSKFFIFAAFTLLAVNIQFIILIRSARYYSPVILFSLLAIYYFYKLIHEKMTRTGLFLLILFLTLLFHSHYLSFFALVFSFSLFIITNELLSTKKINFYRAFKNPISITLAISAVLNIPWILISRSNLTYPGIPKEFIFNIFWYFLELVKKTNRQIPIPLAFLGVYFLYMNLKSKKQNQTTLLFVSILLGVPFFVSTVTALSLPPSIFSDFRYILPAFPIFFIFTGYAVGLIFRKSKMAGVVVFTIVLFTNILSLPVELLLPETYWPLQRSRYEIRSYLYEYISYELNGKYIGPVDAIVNYIKPKISTERNKAFISSEGTAVLFSLPILEVDNDYTFQKKYNRNITPRDLLSYDFILFREICDIKCIFPNDYNFKELNNLLNTYYYKTTLPVHDYIVQNREEIPYHLFKTPTQNPRVVIYEKK